MLIFIPCLKTHQSLLPYYTSSKNQDRNRPKIKFVQLDFSNLIFQKSSADNQGVSLTQDSNLSHVNFIENLDHRLLKRGIPLNYGNPSKSTDEIKMIKRGFPPFGARRDIVPSETKKMIELQDVPKWRGLFAPSPMFG